MKGRTLTLTTALAMAGIAVASVYVYVGRIESETFKGLQTRDVLVATRFLATGSSGSSIVQAGAFAVREVPLKFAAPGALDAPQEMTGLTLVDDVTAGEQLTASRFASPEANVFVADLPDGTEALSLPLLHDRGVSGHVRAGDRINVYVTVEGKQKKALAALLKKSDVPSSAPVFNTEMGITIQLLKSVLVVEVPVPAGAAQTQAARAPTITLAVTGQQAALMVHAQERAKLWYTLAKAEGV